jgi:hypothetical protein
MSSLPGHARTGNLSGLVRNDGARAKTATVTVRAMRSNDALRTGSYSKTLTFTLSTTTP